MTAFTKSLEAVHQGMPELKQTSEKATSFFEFWPSQIIYLPIVIQWLWLALRYRSLTLPLISNPSIYLGGMVGESKSTVLALTGKKSSLYLAPYVSIFNETHKSANIRLVEALNKMQMLNLTFPVIGKPDIGCRGAGVKIIRDKESLKNYLLRFPDQANLLLQKKISYEAEAGIFYIRHPDKQQGEIFSITLKYAPYVIGDGQRSLRQLIIDDPRANKISGIYFKRHKDKLDTVIPEKKAFRLTFAGSHCKGSIFRDGNMYITESLRQTFDDISADIKGFNYGRFDVRFESIEKLMQGKRFHILEINGASSEATHIWDKNTDLKEVYRTLFYQYRTLFRIGNINRKAGHRPPSVWLLYKAWRDEKKLVDQYPETD